MEGASYTFSYLTPQYTGITASIRYGKHRIFGNTSKMSRSDEYIIDENEKEM